MTKKRGLLTKSVIVGISFFCLFVVVIIGVAVLTNTTSKPKEETIQWENNLQEGNTSMAYTIPCVYNQNLPAGCDASRVRTVLCGSVHSNGFPTVFVTEKGPCTSAYVSLSQTLNVQFYQIPGTQNCYEITAQIGECWPKNPINGVTYDCQGQCGAGCVSGCGIIQGGGSWARSCFSHDICSWYFGASGGASDKYCGTGYNNAINDFLKCGCNTVSHKCT